VNFPVKGEKGEALDALAAEGEATNGDLIVTNNLSKLAEASRAGLLAKVESRTLSGNVPAHLRDPDGRWFGIALRARAVMYSTERVKSSELSTYEALGNPKWKERLCLRTSASPYNTLLVGGWIKRHGEKKTEQILGGWMTTNPRVTDKDAKLLKAIASGKCDVAVAHTYYLGRELANDPTFPVAVFWPDQKGAGVHVGVAGAGVAAHAKNRADAIRLLEYLTSPAAQNQVVDANYEYPVNPKVKAHAILDKWGPFKVDHTNVSAAAALKDEALKLAERVGYR
jgi:iron(III) transport system substrate-binding protein